LTDLEAIQLAEDLGFARRIRRSRRNGLGARLPVSLVWGFSLSLAGFLRDTGTTHLWLLIPLTIGASLVTMVLGARLRQDSGELTTSMDRKASIHWTVTGLVMLAGLLALPSSGPGPRMVIGLLAASHLLAGFTLETSYFITAGTLSLGVLYLEFGPKGFASGYPWMLAGTVAWACLVAGALLGKVVYRHGR
jgi:hypothetical protein